MRTTNLRGITSALRLAALGLATLCAANCPAADGDVLAFWKFGKDGLASSTGCGTLLAGDGVTLVGGYAHFDGTKQACLWTPQAINLSALSAVTFDFWVRPTGYGSILYEFGEQLALQPSLSCSYTSPSLPLRAYYCCVRDKSARLNGPDSIHDDGLWHHVAIVCRKADTVDQCLTMYVDGWNAGVSTSSDAGAGGLTALPNKVLNIGCRNGSPSASSYNLTGDIDAFRITEGAVSASGVVRMYQEAEGRRDWMMGADQYVTNGLVALFDARENVSLGGAHDSMATDWLNIAPNPPEGAPTALAIGPGAHWDSVNANALLSDGTDAAATLDGAFVDFAAVEIACDLTGFSDRRSIFECGDGSKRLFADSGMSTQYLRIDGRMTGGLYYRTTGLALQIPCTYSLGVLGDDASLAINAEPCHLESNEGGANMGTRFSLGGRHAEGLPLYSAKGKFSCLRLYNRKLTAGEIRRNDFIDRVRYRGDISPTLWRTNESGAVECRVDVKVVGGGRVRIGDGELGKRVSGWCVLGSSVEVTTVPDDGWSFRCWSGGSVPEGMSSGSLAVDCPMTLNAFFTQGEIAFTHTWAGPEDGDFSTAANWCDAVSGGVCAEPPGPTSSVLIPGKTQSGSRSRLRLAHAAEVANLQLGDDSGEANLVFDTEETLSVASNAVIVSGTISCANLKRITLRVGASMLVSESSALTADGCGFAGNGTGSCQTGCTHGGEKGSLTVKTSETSAYGNAFYPTDLGSGTAANAGGGAIRLVVAGTLALDGLLTANGAGGSTGNVSHGGAGGSVWITAGAIAGCGGIYADGGMFTLSYSGTGGRIAVWLTHPSAGFSDFTGVMSAVGGRLVGDSRSPYSGHGTICRGLADGRNELVLQNTDGEVVASDFRGYTTLPAEVEGDVKRAYRKTAVRLGKYGVLKLTDDLIVSDMDLTEDTSALCLQGHKLTIRSKNHQSTWKGKVDLGGGTIEWVPPPGLLFMLK